METHQSHRSKRKRSDSSGSSDVDRSDEQRPRTDRRETSSSDQDMAEAERVAILDAGAQYAKVIDRRIRELKVESVLLPLNTPADELRQQGFMALIISGSGSSINDPETCTMSYDRDIFSLGIPILGVCYGLHLICSHFGGVVETTQVREDGQFLVTLDTTCPLFQGMSPREKVLLTHGDFVQQVPSCLQEIGWSSNLVTAVSHKSYPFFGIQFHPEVDLTEGGKKLLKNFLFEISGCRGLFELGNRQEKCLKFIKDKVGERKVLSLVSGGVDSTVCTVLLNKALGPEKVLPLHVDNGFLRLGEVEKVVASLKGLGINPHVMDAKFDFSSAHTIMDYLDLDNNRYRRATPRLVSVVNAEEKRHIIGDTFVKLVRDFLSTLENGDDYLLAQGTLRPDLIESASELVSENAHVIKTHHNDTLLVQEMRRQGRVIEPLVDFHKDEVRQLGVELGLPDEILNRHPFPGPGLAVRVICQDEAFIRDEFSSLNMLLASITDYAQACKQPSTVIRTIQHLLSDEEDDFLLCLSQSSSLSATTLPIYTTGVQGDSRTYNYAVALSSNDPPDWPNLFKLAKIIPRICHSVNRVVWVFGPEVQGPIVDVTQTRLTSGVLSTLRVADHKAMSVLAKHGMMNRVSQMPVVLIPIHFDRKPEDRPLIPSCQYSIVLRPFITSDFMTGVAAVPGVDLPESVVMEMAEEVDKVPRLSRVLYDLTSKPPGTTEWE